MGCATSVPEKLLKELVGATSATTIRIAADSQCRNGTPEVKNRRLPTGRSLPALAKVWDIK